MSFVVVDIETTGLSSCYHKITEIAAAKMENGAIIDTFQTLVNPGVCIPSFITRLTGIDNQMVKHAPPIEKALIPFLTFLGHDVFVAHNATFDFGFLQHNAKRHHNITLSNKRLCTKKLAGRMLPSLSSRRLSAVCDYLNITNKEQHRAMSDVHATAEVFGYFLKELQKNNITTIEDITRFEKMPVSLALQVCNPRYEGIKYQQLSPTPPHAIASDHKP